MSQKALSAKRYIKTRRYSYDAPPQPWVSSASTERQTVGGVIGCKQFRVAVMLFGGGPWGVVGCLALRIARHTGPDGIYRAEQVGRTARAARHHPKERLLDHDVVLRRRMIGDLPRQHTRRQISAPVHEDACGTLPSMDTSPKAQGTISHEAIFTWSRHQPPRWGEPGCHDRHVQRRLAPHRRQPTARTGSYQRTTSARQGIAGEPSWRE